MKQKVLSALALFVLVVVGLALPAPASAAPGGLAMWKANAGSSLSGTMTGGNTSIETTDAFKARDVAAGTVLDLDYTLGDGATCIGGAPRVFATVDGNTVNSWDQHIADGVEAACKGEVTLPGGKLTAIGVVWDNGQSGTITVTSLKLGSDSLSFNEKTDLTVATPQKPKYDKPTCDTEGVVTPRTTEGIDYVRTDADGKATVKAVAQAGYALEKGKTRVWTFDVAKLDCEQPPAPIVIDVAKAAPKVYVDCKGGAGADLTDKNVDYTFVKWEGEYAVFTGKADEGYVFSDGKTEATWRVKAERETGCEQPGGGTPTTGTPSASSSPTVVPGAVGGGTSGDLPKTGVKVLGMAGGGGLLVAVGGLLLVLMRRRRDQGSGVHREDGDTQVMPAI